MKPLTDPRPLYVQIEERLRGELREGELTPGDRLPPEVKLAEKLGVSRATVRRALEDLEATGLVERRRGRGTVISQPPLAQPLSGLFVLRQTAAEAGVQLETSLEDVKTVPAETGPPELSSRGGRLLWFWRRHISAGVPAAIEQMWLADATAEDIERLLKREPTSSVYEVLRALGRPPQWAEDTIEAVIPESPDAEKLETTGPVVRLKRVSGYDGESQEVRTILIRSDRVLLTNSWGTRPEPLRE